MTDRELMQQALDALFNLRWAASERDKKNRIRQFDEFMDGSDEAIEALRARLAQPEPEPVAWTYQHEDTGLTMCVLTQPAEPGFEKNNPRWQKSTPLYTAPPQREWQGLTDEAFERGKKEIDMEQVKDIAQKLADCALLNSAPPQREWQGLTENEIKHLWYEACQTNLELTSQLIVHLARNIEAKLKERNT